MLEAGSEKDIKNKQGHTPSTIVAPTNPQLKQLIQDYGYGDEEEDASEKHESNYLDYDEVAEGEDDERSVYSGSDSDEEEEFKRLKAERAKKENS